MGKNLCHLVALLGFCVPCVHRLVRLLIQIVFPWKISFVRIILCMIGREDFFDHFVLYNDLPNRIVIIESVLLFPLLILDGRFFHLSDLALSSQLFSVFVLVLKPLQVALSFLLLIPLLSLLSLDGFDLED